MAALGMCETPGCKSIAQLQCPTCIKLGIQGSFFCNQDCFKKSWKNHKIIHSLAKGETTDGSAVEYNPWPSYNFTGKLKPHPPGPKRTVPASIGRPDYADHPTGFPASENAAKGSGHIKVLDDEEIEGMRVACRLGREVLDEAANPLNYHNFPNSCCTSDGDVCNVDVTVYHRGFHGDLNESFFVGNVPETTRKLVEVTYECLMKAIDIVKPGEKYREIGNVIQKHAQANGFSVVRSYCGHGIHRLFHTAPNVPHYAKNKAVGVMKPGHCFTIEPMINEGSWRDEQWPDHWTAVTADGSRSAQFEQTLLVTETGCDILTKRASGRPWFMDQLEKLNANS
ncbi:hypothetical protein MSG28_002649 [Choristoneura fumiferana]|uniref:Uncharacterized protein n=1 Tax=Choristoneura fumiferana TaxID=7141 RepID=A0ACC0JJ13_CHOFU|nr:hypothetical protein MSG28_002649 [Choristoneura fumiferana]